MRIDRVELATPNETVELSFHPNVTLVGGLGRLEREALTSEILGAIGPGRPGLSVDLVAENGRLLEVRRPLGAEPTVRDVRTSLDFTDDFLHGGSVDVLHTLGFHRDDTRRHLHLTPQSLTPATVSADARIERLASVDQQVLWGAGITLAEVEVEIAAAANDVAEDELDSLRPQIEQAHAATEIAADQFQDAKGAALPIGITLALVALLAGVFVAPVTAVPFVLGAAGLLGRVGLRYRSYQAAITSEEAVLAEAGITSYLDLQMRKVDEFTSTPADRSRSLELAETHRYAKQSWEAIVGEGVTLEWAAAHRAEITEAASRKIVIDRGDAARDVSDQISLALTQARSIAEEAVPVVLDDPFTELSDDALNHLLPTLDFHSPHIQLILLSDDARVTEWAKALEGRQGALTVQLGSPVPVRTAPSRAKIQSSARSIVRARRGAAV